MTNQEAFDTIVKGLASQGFQRSMVGAGCRFRDRQGRKCAVGWVIPDEKYYPGLEGTAIHSLRLRGLVPMSVDGALLQRAMSCHDGGTTPASMMEALVDCADRFQLKLPKELAGA